MKRVCSLVLAWALPSAVMSVLLGLLVRLEGTWNSSGRAAVGCFAFSAVFMLARGVSGDRVSYRVRTAVTWGALIALGYVLAAGTLGRPYEVLGVRSAGPGRFLGVVAASHRRALGLVYGAALGGWSWGALAAFGVDGAQEGGAAIGAVAGLAVIWDVEHLGRSAAGATEHLPNTLADGA